MNSLDAYPSTTDMPSNMPIIAGGQDGVLALMEGARKRLVKGHTISAYIRDTYQMTRVCAVGALFAEQGLTGEVLAGATTGASLCNYLTRENLLKEDTLTAMKLLDEATVELIPRSADSIDRWMGPLEWVNQSWAPDEYTDNQHYTPRASWCVRDPESVKPVVKTTILGIYDYAIAKRRGAIGSPAPHVPRTA